MRSLILIALAGLSAAGLLAEEPWSRHAIDDSFRGADGVRLADFNGDSLVDIVTGWEESGIIRLYLNPGPLKATRRWPSVSVGRSPSPEDAVPMDVDGDGRLDIVSCHEGKTRQVLVHFNRAADADQLLEPSSWETAELKQLSGQAWMFALPIELRDGRAAMAIGSKGSDASITLVASPADDAGNLARWTATRLRDAGWIMSLRTWDMDGDGDQDVVFSDRKGKQRGVGWLQQPNDRGDRWVEHEIGGADYEVMFLDIGPGTTPAESPQILVSTRNSIWMQCRPQRDGWIATEFANPPSVPNGKAIARLSPRQLVMTANTHSGNVPHVAGVWLRRDSDPWQAISDNQGGKYDRIEVIDLNGDQLPDVLTCEERQNLGVVWYENPGP